MSRRVSEWHRWQKIYGREHILSIRCYRRTEFIRETYPDTMAVIRRGPKPARFYISPPDESLDATLTNIKTDQGTHFVSFEAAAVFLKLRYL